MKQCFMIGSFAFMVKKDNQQYHYASIAEVYHPDYLGLEELKEICKNEVDGVVGKDADTIDFLNIARAKMRSI